MHILDGIKFSLLVSQNFVWHFDYFRGYLAMTPVP
jgi:hypothetical protein